MYKNICAIVVLAIMIIVLPSCQKENTIQENINDELIRKSSEMTQHILAFKEKMKFYKGNPGLKSGESYTADEAVFEVEAALSFTYCFSNIEKINQQYTTSMLTMNLENGMIAAELLSQFQEEVIDTIQSHMANLEYTNKKLLVVDIENTGPNEEGDAIISVTSLAC